MTKRLGALLFCAALAAAPLAWMTINPHSGDQLLQLTQSMGFR